MTKGIADIVHGMTIDHLPLEATLRVFREMRSSAALQGRCNMFMGEVKSTRMGRKGLIKLDGIHLAEGDKALNSLGILSPDATVNWITDGRVQRKERRACTLLPDFVETDVVQCTNANCISHEEAGGKYRVLERAPLVFQCHYCDRIFSQPPV